VIDFERLAYLVSNQCTVRESDCYAVLRALEHNIMDELKQGKVVQLGGLGNLQVGVSSNGEVLAESVSGNTVKKAHINFRPGAKLRDYAGNCEIQNNSRLGSRLLSCIF